MNERTLINELQICFAHACRYVNRKKEYRISLDVGKALNKKLTGKFNMTGRFLVNDRFLARSKLITQIQHPGGFLQNLFNIQFRLMKPKSIELQERLLTSCPKLIIKFTREYSRNR
jgi:hypothetical protein